MKITQRSIIILTCTAVVAATIFTTVFNIIQNKTTTRIGFYSLPENIETSLKTEITNTADSKIKFLHLNSDKPLSKKQTKNFDIIFTLNSRTAVDINPEPIPENIMQYVPSKVRYSTFQNNKNYALPVLLDHFEIALYTTYQTKVNANYPSDYTSFKQYLKDVKQYAQFPLIAIGTDDRELIGFVSALTQSMYGVNEYFDICAELNKAQARNEELPYRIRVVLDEIKNLQYEGLLPANWINASKKDVTFLMENHHLGSVATYLSTQREFPYVLIKYYDSYIFPQESKEPFGIIAPEICALKMKDTKKSDLILEKLMLPESQSKLSESTMLAPAASVAESSDEQADNVRYWCASAEGGPVPTLQETSFITTERFHDYAEKIREYLK